MATGKPEAQVSRHRNLGDDTSKAYSANYGELGAASSSTGRSANGLDGIRFPRAGDRAAAEANTLYKN